MYATVYDHQLLEFKMELGQHPHINMYNNE